MGKAIDQAVAGIMKFMSRAPWNERLHDLMMEYLEQPARELECEPGDIPAMLEAPGAGHMLFGMVIEHLMIFDYEEPPRNLIDDFLKRRGWKVPTAGREYLRQLRDSTLRYYEMIDAEPDSHVVIRDLLSSGDPIRVHEKLGSRGLYRWDRLVARVLRRNKRFVFSGGFLSFRGEEGQALLRMWQRTGDEAHTLPDTREVRDALGGQGLDETEQEAFIVDMVTAQLVETLPMVYTQLWLAAQLGALNAPMPELRNHDGDPLLFGEARFAIAPGRQHEAAAGLDGLTGWERAEPGSTLWNWTESASTDAATPAPTDYRPGRGPGTEVSYHALDAGGGTLLGTAQIRDGGLIFTANSRQRTERG